MLEDKDHEFFDLLYQQWSQTTGAKDSYYTVVDRGSEVPEAERYQVFATDADKWERYIAQFANEEDADFFAGMHGAIPELIRRLHDAIDEAVRKDEQNDIAQGQLAEALVEINSLKVQLRDR